MRFITLVETSVRDYRKRQRLFKRELTDEDPEGFKERNLSDTQYITWAVYNLLNDHLKFAEDTPFGRKPVRAVNGAVTDYMRKRLGLPHYDPEEMVRPVFVSRMPNRKVSGAAHKETIRSGKLPQKAVAAYAAAENRREMRDSDFLFPLYAGDLIRIKAKKPIGLQLANKDASGEPELQRKEWMLYYVSAGITTGSITVTTHDRKYQKGSLGLKTLLSIEKYEVDPLGEYHKVHTPEKRQTFR